MISRYATKLSCKTGYFQGILQGNLLIVQLAAILGAMGLVETSSSKSTTTITVGFTLSDCSVLTQCEVLTIAVLTFGW